MFLNEYEPYAAQWLRNLYPEATVDERSITEITGADCGDESHFFAGIGGWPYALALAGWPAGRPVWTGSCPCQPFSAAGKRQGQADERHLWPAWFRLIRERRPATIFGEQVEGAVGHGWLDGVFTDMEAEGYACGAVVLGAHSVGAPHIRQRLYWVAERLDDPAGPRRDGPGEGAEGPARDQARLRGSECGRGDGGLAYADLQRRAGVNPLLREEAGRRIEVDLPETPWRSVAIPCADGRWRRVPATEAGEPEPGLFPLAHGVPGRVGRLRAYGNAIVPQAAAAFIRAFLETEGGLVRAPTAGDAA